MVRVVLVPGVVEALGAEPEAREERPCVAAGEAMLGDDARAGAGEADPPELPRLEEQCSAMGPLIGRTLRTSRPKQNN